MPFQFRKEAIEEDLNSNFPSQGQGNPPLYYSLSEVVVPTYSINNVAEGTSLPESLQQAWDFSTGYSVVAGSTVTLVNNPGFWKVNVIFTGFISGGLADVGLLAITDGLSSKTIWNVRRTDNVSADAEAVFEHDMIVFLKTGESLTGTTPNNDHLLTVNYRQVAEVNGTLVNPLGFSFA